MTIVALLSVLMLSLCLFAVNIAAIDAITDILWEMEVYIVVHLKWQLNK